MKFLIAFVAIVAVATARPRISAWTLQELSDALQSPNLNPAFTPILEQALNDLMASLVAGEHVDSIIVPLPAGVDLYPVESAPVVPTPVVPAPVVPTPVEAAPSVNAPLVQIIVNVKGQQQVADVVAPSPVIPEISEVIPTPVHVVEGPQEVIVPTPVQVVEGPQEVIPEPVIVVPAPINPSPVNPIDVIAVNPVDSWGPVGLMPAIDTEDVGPL